MAGNVKVAISTDLLTAFAKLPRSIQGKVTEFINKFKNNPLHSGISYEKIKNAIDPKFCSVRIDQTYRGIVVREEESDTYLLLWVDHHDAAYAWAQRKKCVVNPKSGAIQVFDVQTTPVEIVPSEAVLTKEKLPFALRSTDELLELGVPAEQIQFVRGIKNEADFVAAADALPKDAYEYLSWLVQKVPYNEVLELARSDREKAAAAGTLAAALETPLTLKSFVVIEGDDELRKILAEPLAKWRVFLHPTQKRLVRRNYSGPARVLGAAGTGKTVVAMHRAKYLASQLRGKEKILFTTYTANLVTDIEENLRKICSVDEMRHIDVINIDAWVSRFLREQGYNAEIIYNESVLEDIWNEALAMVSNDPGMPIGFYQEEWVRVVAPQEAFSMAKYAAASRNGRGTRLDRKKRLQIWKVFEAYQQLLRERGERDVLSALYECTTLAAKLPEGGLYKHVIVDEGQDLGPNAFKLLRTLAGPEHENDMFIVGDAHQRIYKNKAVLGQCGVNIRGRSSILRINYRTTEEIRQYAFALLNGISFDDLDDSTDAGDRCQSLTHGEAPQVSDNLKDIAKETEFIAGEIKKLTDAGVPLPSICVVARTNKLLNDYLARFTALGFQVFQITGKKTDDSGKPGLRLATMHRVKGLEFQYVFVAAVNNNVVPQASVLKKASDEVAKEEAITAEKCLLYVALTRAQKGAYITWYGQKSPFLK